MERCSLKGCVRQRPSMRVLRRSAAATLRRTLLGVARRGSGRGTSRRGLSVPDGFPASAAEWTAAAPARVSTRWVTEAGRAALVWAPCYAIMGPRFSPGVGFAAATLLASVWLVSLRSAFSAVHLTLGVPIRCAVGTATGFVAASALALWVPGLGMAGWTILALSPGGLHADHDLGTGRPALVSKRRVLVVGPSATAAEIAEVIQLEGRLPFAVVGAVDDEPATRRASDRSPSCRGSSTSSAPT